MHLLALTALLALAAAAPLPAQPVTGLVSPDYIHMDKDSMMGETRTVMTSSKDDMDMISGMTADMGKREKRDMMLKAEMMPKEMLMPGMSQGKTKGTKRDVMMEKPGVEMMMMEEEDGMMEKEKMVGHEMNGDAMMKEEMGVMKDMDMRKRGMVKGDMMMMTEKEMGMNMDVQKAEEIMG